ncbi:MAG: hypothetical protein A3F42_06045 [Gammaproteobacteria bacterium RIFCSPHIGHO2_12_FULL_37_34]|nr:MAG: hypothetical protein A3F42_06045 [Gammaproteobacteria bacterium RIFCSPHIGHO2_12_FULL_37_34]
MKKHHISVHSHGHGSTLYITHRHTIYAIPKNIADKYVVEEDKRKRKKPLASIKSIFEKLEKKYTRAGALLKGLRLREGLSQVSFSKKINITQANLSNMENGHRPIGKILAKRIEKVFGTNYRYFLE